MRQAMGDLRERVPVVENNSLLDNTVEVVYRDGRLRVEVGPDADAHHVRYHQETARLLLRYEGLVGAIRILISRVRALLGGGPGIGQRGFEAGLEVDKLVRILNDLEAQRDAIDDRARRLSQDIGGIDEGGLSAAWDPAERAAVDADIAAIQGQLARHLRDINSTAAGRGRIAMESTTPQRPGDEGFFRTLEIGETRTYEDLGENVGIASRPSSDITVIETSLQVGQSTPRGDFQRQAQPAPEIDTFPIGEGGFERLHAVGPLIGHESPHGILWGPFELNRALQEHGMETHIAQLREQLPTGATLHLVVIVERQVGQGEFAGVEFLKRVSYELHVELPGETARSPVMRQEIVVDNPQDPNSSFDFGEPVSLVQDQLTEGGTPSSPPPTRAARRVPDIRPEHEQAPARRLYEGAGELVQVLRGHGDAGTIRRRQARLYASMLNTFLRRIRSHERLTQDDVSNIQQQIGDIFELFPSLRSQFGDLVE